MHASDHSLIDLVLEPSPTMERGPGFWRFPTDLLSDPVFTADMRDFLVNWDPPQDISSPTVTWEWLKYEIRSFVRKFTRSRRNEEAQYLADLKKELSEFIKRRDDGEPDLAFYGDKPTK